MASNDPAGSCETYACAGEFALRVESLERPEKPVGIAGIEARAVVAHEVNGPRGFLGVAEFDFR
jgi:hypothetical protein